FEMQLGYVAEGGLAVLGYVALAGFDYLRGGAFGELDAVLLAQPFGAPQKAGSGEDGGGGYRYVGLGADHRLEGDRAPALEELALEAGGVSELVGDDEVAWALLQDVLDRAGVAPGEQLVEVAEL